MEPYCEMGYQRTVIVIIHQRGQPSKVARVVTLLGKNTLLDKVDIKRAYRMVLAHAEDRMLLGMKWQGSVHVDTCLPFGLQSAPRVFTTLADAIKWEVQHWGVTWILHYLDDYITFGAPAFQECAADVATLREVRGTDSQGEV